MDKTLDKTRAKFYNGCFTDLEELAINKTSQRQNINVKTSEIEVIL